MRVQSWLRYNAVGTVVLGAAALLVLSSPAHADPIWDLVGDYTFGFYVQDGIYSVDVDITSQNFAAGTFTPTSPDPGVTIAGGTFDGSNISFTDVYSGGLTVFDGSISANGTFSGTVISNNGHGLFYGSFSTYSGMATEENNSLDFELFELSGGADCPGIPAGSTGCFDLVNNTDFAVTGFAVGNDSAESDSTTRANWNADIDSVDFGGGTESSFEYFDEGGADANPLVDGSDSSFFYTTATSGSPFEIFANGPEGEVSCIGTTGGGCDAIAASPEPGSLALAGAGLAALWFTLRKKRTSVRRLARHSGAE